MPLGEAFAGTPAGMAPRLAGQPALAQLPCRFDVIALSGERDGARIDWIRNAFTLDDVR